MKLLNKISIKSRIILSFIVIVLLLVGFGGIALSGMRDLGELTLTLYEHPLQVSNSALRAKASILSMHRSMKDVSISKSPAEVYIAIQAVTFEEQAVYRELDNVKRQILGEEGKNMVNDTLELFAGWKPIRLEVEELVLAGDIAAANEITRNKGALYVSRLEVKMEELTSYARFKADGFMKDAQEVEAVIRVKTVIFIGAVIILSTLIGILVVLSILSSLSSLRKTMSKISSTGVFIQSHLEGNNEITELAGYFNQLILKLHDQFWYRESLHRLNGELSADLSFNDLLEKSITTAAKTIEACTGALFLFDKDQSVCELKASYAFVETNYSSDRFKLGEGIVGQVALEKCPVMLKNISREEATGRTGTLSEPPKSIYAMPLVYENELHGVLEVAAFEEINSVKKEYLDAAADVISITLAAALKNNHIRKLLESSGRANEKLQAQSEELQAQTEELQAQSEELQAQTEELEAMNEELKKQAGELQQQNVELDEQRQQVEAANRLKSEFLSNMSHELRTPLNSVLALSRLLISQVETILSSEQVNYLEIIERNGKHLLALINDILDLSRIEAGKMEVTPHIFSLGGLLETITESLEPVAREKGIQLTHSIPDDLPLLESDESGVHQIIQNLIGNAVKFTKTGSVMVTAVADTEKVTIRVADTGIGISATDLPNIFEEFRQVDGSSSRHFEGTGLGLAIAAKASKMLQGTITVESEPGKGSVFTVTFPIKWGQPVVSPETEQEIPPRATSGKKTILIVDDDKQIRDALSAYLSEANYETITASNGKEALKLAELYQPLAVTLDIVMPEMDGWELLQQLRKNPVTKEIPVIIVSVTEDSKTGFALGAAGYVSKPVYRKSLLDEIRKMGKADLNTVMVVDDNEFERKEIADIIERAGLEAVLAETGERCLELMKESLPDLLVLDLMMPGLNGFEVMDNIRSTPRTRDLPVIMVTAKDLGSEDMARLKGNVSNVLAKKDTLLTDLATEIKRQISGFENKPTSQNPGKGAFQARILLVEDNESAVIQVSSVLSSGGYTVDVANNGQQALDYFKHTIPDGVILDLMMPGVDGFMVLNKIRETSETADIPVLVLTAKDLTQNELDRLASNNIKQLIQKGDVDRDGLLQKTRLMLADRPEPKKDLEIPIVTAKISSSLNTGSRTRSKDDRPTILIVEDNPDNMITIKAVLGNRYRILEANDGNAGLQKALGEQPDLVLLDMSLPGMDGITVVKKIREQEASRNLPVIAITARAMKGDQMEIIKAGCSDYISKPIDPEIVISKVEHWLNRGIMEG